MSDDNTDGVVVVTGSSGLIGAALVRRLAPRFSVVGFDRAGDPYPPEEAECVCVDVTDADSVTAGFRRVRYAYGGHLAAVVHLAAYYDFSGAPDPRYQTVTVEGTARLLDHLADFDVDQIVFSSTMLVHAPTRPGRRIDEESPLAGDWSYPASKITTEQLLRDRRGDAAVVLARLAGVYDDRGHSPPLAGLISRIARRRLTSRFYPADPAVGQAFVHLDDAVEALALAVERREDLPAELAVLVGEPSTLPYRELQTRVGQLLHGEPWPTYRIPAPLAKAGARLLQALPGRGAAFVNPFLVDRAADHYELDISRARDLLGWHPAHALDERLPRIIDTLRADPDAWYRANHLDPPRRLNLGERGSRPARVRRARSEDG